MVQAVAVMHGVVYDASSSYDASRSYNDNHRRDLLVQGTLEMLAGRGWSYGMVPASS